MQTFCLVLMKCSSFIPTIDTFIEAVKVCEKVPFTDLLSPLFCFPGYSWARGLRVDDVR